MQISFVGLLDSATYNYARQLQTDIYYHFGLTEELQLEPHITLKYKFDITDLSAAEKYFDELASGISPITMTINGIGTFEENEATFLKIEKNAQLTDLHLRILTDVATNFTVQPGEFEGQHLPFHITLSKKVSDEGIFQRVKDYLGSTDPRLQSTMTHLGMYLLPASSAQWFLYRVGELKIRV